MDKDAVIAQQMSKEEVEKVWKENYPAEYGPICIYYHPKSSNNMISVSIEYVKEASILLYNLKTTGVMPKNITINTPKRREDGSSITPGHNIYVARMDSEEVFKRSWHTGWGKFVFKYKYKLNGSVYETEHASLFFVSTGCGFNSSNRKDTTDEEIVVYVDEPSSVEHAIRLVTRYVDLSNMWKGKFVIKCGDVERVIDNVKGYLL